MKLLIRKAPRNTSHCECLIGALIVKIRKAMAFEAVPCAQLLFISIPEGKRRDFLLFKKMGLEVELLS